MRIDEKLSQTNLLPVRVFYDSDYEGTILIAQGKEAIYIDLDLALRLSEIFAKINKTK